MSRPSWKRRLGMAAVLVWMALLVLAGWPRLVRPDFLDGPNRFAFYTLRLLGISAGQPLFQTQVSPWKQHGYCLFVRERGAPGRMLFPPGGECRIQGFHPRLPPVSRATHRMLSSAWELRERDREGMAGLVSAIGRAFCRQPESRPAGVEAVWIWYYKHYDDGSVARRNGLWFDYACAGPDPEHDTGGDRVGEQLGELVWEPDDRLVIERWGTAPW